MEFFRAHKIKAKQFCRQFRSILREKIPDSQKNISCQLLSADVPPQQLPVIGKRQKHGNQGFKTSAEAGHGSSAPL